MAPDHDMEKKNPSGMQTYLEHESDSGELHKERTIGDDFENTHALKGDDSDGRIAWTPRTLFAAITLCGLYTGSQIALYFVCTLIHAFTIYEAMKISNDISYLLRKLRCAVVGGSLSYIAADLGASTGLAWLPVSNTLAITAVAPFTGYLQDLLGRRIIAIFGSIIICIGIILVGTAHTFGQGVTGMSLAGAGAGICELTSLAGISDIVPVKQRGTGLAVLIFFIVPFTPYVMYSQLLATHASWRWSMWISLIYNAVVLCGLITFYFPKTHPRAEGLSKRDILKRIDYLGAFLSIVGPDALVSVRPVMYPGSVQGLTINSLVALQEGGYTHPWKSARVLCNLLIGLFLIIGWIFWEWKGAKYPMVPGALFKGQRIVALAYFIAFVAGVNFYSLLNFFPISFSAVYDPDPIQVGLKGLGYGISVTVGAVFFNAMLTWWKGHAREILLFATVLMTAFGGAIALSTPLNPKLTVAMGTIAGFGVGGVLVPSATVALIVVPDSLLATAAALSLSIRTVGGSIGYSIYYNIFASKLTTRLPAYVAEYAIKAGLPAAEATDFVTTFLTAPGKIMGVPGVNAAIVEAAIMGSRWAYSDSLKYVWYTSIPFGILAILSCCLMPSIKNYQTNRIAAAL